MLWLKEFNFWLERRLVLVVMCKSAYEREHQRTETLICDDMLIYSLELLHWPWIGGWLCALVQCLPKVSYPSEFDRAITFKAQNVPLIIQKTAQDTFFCVWDVSLWKHLRHTCTWTRGCITETTQIQPHAASAFQPDRAGVWLHPGFSRTTRDSVSLVEKGAACKNVPSQSSCHHQRGLLTCKWPFSLCCVLLL